MITSRLSAKNVTVIILSLACAVALFFRIYLPYKMVFSGDWIKFASVDAYYHMRLVDNLLHNFPRLISFDPYFIYPSAVPVGSVHLFERLLAGIIWVIGLGSPSPHTADIIGVYFPAVLGALTIIPVYFIGKELFGRWGGVLSACLLAVLPGEFMGRSVLGFTDQHITETFLTSLIILFLVMAIKTARQRGITFRHLRHPERTIIAQPIIYSLLAGVVMGIYLLSWAGAPLFVFIIFVYFIIQFIIDHLKRRSTDYLCLVSVIFFLVSLLMFLPAASLKMHMASLVVALLVPIFLSIIAHLFASRKIKPAYYPLGVLGLGMAVLAIFYAVATPLLRLTMSQFSIFAPESISALTTAEMQPLLSLAGNMTLAVAWRSFTTGFFLALIALVILIYQAVKQGESEKSLLIVWSLVILAATLGQRRFAYYFAVNVALLSGYLCWQVLSTARFREWLAKAAPGRKREDMGRPKRMQRQNSDLSSSYIKKALAGIIIFFIVIFPNVEPAIATAKQVRFAPSDAWCESLTWLKANAPNPFGNPQSYYELYNENSAPQPDFGVLAWWDYGYWITRMAHQVPDTNPSQEPTPIIKAARFFTATSEAYANKIRGSLGSDYVIIDYDTAVKNTGAIATWIKRDTADFSENYYYLLQGQVTSVRLYNLEYYRSLAARLYNFDGKAVTPQSSLVISYDEKLDKNGQPFKELISSKSFPSYEEATNYVSSQKTGNYKIVGNNPFISPVPLEEVKSYKLVYSSEESATQPEAGDVPLVKIFKYVKAE